MRSVSAETFGLSLLTDLSAVVDGLRLEDLHSLTSTALGEDLCELHSVMQRLEAEFTRRVAHFDRTQGHAACGAVSSAAWLRGRCRIRGGAAADRVRVGRRLDDLPVTAQAFGQGRISYQHATVIARCAEEVGVEPVRTVEPALVEAAQFVDPGRLRLATRHLRHCLDPDGSLAGAEKDFERRHLYFSQCLDGFYAIDGLLDAESGEVVRTALEALTGPPAPGDKRTAPQRRSDALAEMARRQLDAGRLPEVGGEKPHLTL
ncbi:MAG: 13E12 repeat family protein, partial [Candidatus Dormibacteraeota bacterium]|nr:13E12 repeat family protein [Candidatus Dormibacteraeota bacterium]